MTTNRRMFLRGAAGLTLAIPFLSSLLPRQASAGPGPKRRRLITIGTCNGGVKQVDMVPDASALPESMSYAGRTIWRGPLAPTSTAGGRTVVSPVMSADSGRLTPGLLNKMNVLRGLDIPYAIGHTRGGQLGHFGDGGNTVVVAPPVPTIDQVLAWSKTFYPSLDAIKERSLQLDTWYGPMSWGYSSPSTQSGEVQGLASDWGSQAVFDRLFPAPVGPTPRAPLVDLVLADYKRLRTSNRRLSAGDRQRLDDYMDRMSEVQRKIKAQGLCGNVPKPSNSTEAVQGGFGEFLKKVYEDPSKHVEWAQIWNDLIVTALSCDASRIVTLQVGDYHAFVPFSGTDWHGEVTHALDQPARYQQLTDSRQQLFEKVFVDLASKLDAVKEDEGTLLDASLLQMTQQCGPNSHEQVEMSIVTAGSAGGFFKTGQHADFRNRDVIQQSDVDWQGMPTSTRKTNRGLLYHQWLGTVLQSMGLSPAEYKRDPVEGVEFVGYGMLKLRKPEEEVHPYDYAQEKLVANEVVPFVKA